MSIGSTGETEVIHPPSAQETLKTGPPRPPQEPDTSGGDERTFARYRILGELGRGGMGIVYKTYDPKLKRVVALKVLLIGEDASSDEVLRFFREAESAARLKHPNIVPIHELDVHEGKHYFTMDLVEGTPLDEIIGKGVIEPRRAVELMERIARAVHYAHEQGIIHRDLKPSNVIISNSGEPMVMDFGLARQVKSESSLTQSGVFMGTPDYASPEQAMGRTRELDAKSDVFSLGSVFYEMLTRRVPFVGDSTLGTLNAIVKDDPVTPRTIAPHVPRDAEVITLKCLEKDRSRRYPSASELAEDCRRLLEGEPISARPASLIYRTRKKLARHKAVTAVVGLAAMMTLALAGWSYVSIVRERNAAVVERDRALKAERREADQRGLAEEKRREADEARTQAMEARRAAEQARQREEGLRRQAESALEAERQLRRIEGELDIAAAVQASLLAHKIPMIEGYDFYGWLRTATEVGGGYSDWIPITSKTIEDLEIAAPEGAKMAMVMAQAPTRGIPGAIQMSRVRTLAHAVLPETGTARASLLRINDQLMRDVLRWPEDMRAGQREHGPVQMLVAILEVDTKTVRVCNAGYEPPAVFRAKSGKLEFPCQRGKPLGKRESAEIGGALAERTVVLAPGDRLILFSEGFHKVRDAEGAEYGKERFLGLVRAKAALRSRDFTRALVSEFDRYKAGADQRHDMVLSTVRLDVQGGVELQPNGHPRGGERPSRQEEHPSRGKSEVF